MFVAHAIAREQAHNVEQQPLHDGQRHPDTRWEDAVRAKDSNEHIEDEEKRHQGVNEAAAILAKIKPPSVSKLAKYTKKPKGVFGSTAYYAKEAFVLLFMNAPKEDTLISTTAPSQPAKLARPLSKAVRLLEDAAKENDADAIYMLAELNFYGKSTHPINYEQAFERYKQLAELYGSIHAGIHVRDRIEPAGSGRPGKELAISHLRGGTGRHAFRDDSWISTPRWYIHTAQLR
jgi:TPR repeat protein